MLLLVKRPDPVPQCGAAIHYRDIGDYLTREQKLKTISKAEFAEVEWVPIMPNEQGDWLNQRSEQFLGLRPVAVIQSEDSIPSLTPLFRSSSFGIIAGRDAWVFNSSANRLRSLVERQVAFFNKQVQELQGGADVVTSDPTQFKWDLAAERLARRGIPAVVQPSGFRSAIYRPFFRQHYYMDKVLTSAVSQIPTYFPLPGIRNPAIVVERGLRASGRSPAVIAVDTVTEGAIAGASGQRCQMLPRYVYDERSNPSQKSLLPDEPSPRDNITDHALIAYRARYGPSVTKDNIFSYVYGVLHSPEYRERYAADLAKLLPRIPEVSTAESFHAFSEAGQRLLDMHIQYEHVEPYPLIEQISCQAPHQPDLYRVTKMRWGGTTKAPDLSKIIYNEWITLAGIPDQAHKYVVGPRSALAWLLDRYQLRTVKPSGIVNDPNDWGSEMGEPRYIIDLVKRVTTLSMETMAIVNSLPPLQEDSKTHSASAPRSGDRHRSDRLSV